MPPAVLFWRDMLGVGSAVNVAASVAALAVAASGGPMALAVGLHFAPLPYNLFLFCAVWRAPWRSAFTAAVGMVWLGVMTVL